MENLVAAVPDVDVMLDMPTEELAGIILPLIRGRMPAGMGMAHLGNFVGEFRNNYANRYYPREKQKEAITAFTEAFCWLEAQGLLIPAPDSNGSNGFRVLSRRAAAFENATDFAAFVSARRLPPDLIHPRIRGRVWPLYLRSDYETAAFVAMKEVEVAVREAAGFGNDKYGVNMVREAFRAGGPLHDAD